MVLCEHHCATDGYLPSPLLLASAIAARTERLILNLVLLLPFYDPARLAEDIAVLDHISAGRAGRNGLGLLANGVVPGMRERMRKPAAITATNRFRPAVGELT
ncbi:hypothetical protein GCM10010409_07450 [Mycolicibacterium diernhoferi]|uniref:Luciferase-like domain-containing protein n=1 Tax=Mycolicibacterium diernhoferi TaxID=1801 RepID=A0A1Q4H427_9MYCO|nr:hypothetical protein BRW64_27485 [Mycolicibacterium diernhoferi]OPE54095.1 hypothetical protein BV510_12160 [Mycolicibacterium diernhoferi]